jgi:hypothetical protein
LQRRFTQAGALKLYSLLGDDHGYRYRTCS